MLLHWAMAHFDAPTILVPVDLDPPSRAAVKEGIDLAHVLRGRVVLLHVVRPTSFPEGTRLFPQESIEPVDVTEYISANARRAVNEYFMDLLASGVEARSEVRTGHPVDTILSAIQEDGVDLLVVGTHGRKGLSHAFLGSVAERLVQRSPVSVVVARERA